MRIKLSCICKCIYQISNTRRIYSNSDPQTEIFRYIRQLEKKTTRQEDKKTRRKEEKKTKKIKTIFERETFENSVTNNLTNSR